MNPRLVKELPLAKGKAIFDRIAKLALYRECVALALAVPDKRQKKTALSEVRREWHKHRGDGGLSLQLSIASCLDRIAYGRMCISKARLRTIPTASDKYDWQVQNPMREQIKAANRREDKKDPFLRGNLQGYREDFVPMSNWGYRNIDPDHRKKHFELIDRQHFMGPHWRGKPQPVDVDKLSSEDQLIHALNPVVKVRMKKHSKDF